MVFEGAIPDAIGMRVKITSLSKKIRNFRNMSDVQARGHNAGRSTCTLQLHSSARPNESNKSLLPTFLSGKVFPCSSLVDTTVLQNPVIIN